MNKTINISNPKSISKITVERLFNRYSYSIPKETSKHLDLSNLLILYGENGTGKTRILNLVYHMLCPVPGGGHRSYIANQPFKKFQVSISNGISITAERPGEILDGDFLWSVSNKKKIIAQVFLKVDKDKTIHSPLPDPEEAEYTKIIDVIKSLDIEIFFLSDDRKILTTTPANRSREETESTIDLIFEDERQRQIETLARITREKFDKPEILPLNSAIEKLVTWIRSQVYKGSNEGETNASTIYSDVIKFISESQYTRKNIPDSSISELLLTIDNLASTNKEYSDLGLIPFLNMGTIAEIIRNTEPKGTKTILYDVTKPYVDGFKARFRALEEIKDKIRNFLRNINSFYIDKTVHFNLTSGIQTISSSGQVLTPNMLSSGEKQLLLLFCHTIIASEKSSIFIIDEPEISLNITWQRKLIRALLECGGNNNLQLLLATHSIELLTQYSSNVVRLLNIQKGSVK